MTYTTLFSNIQSMSESKLDIAKATVEVVKGGIPPIEGLKPYRIALTLYEVGKLYRQSLEMNSLARTNNTNKVSRFVYEAVKGDLRYWEQIFRIAGLGPTLNRLEVLIASDFIRNGFS